MMVDYEYIMVEKGKRRRGLRIQRRRKMRYGNCGKKVMVMVKIVVLECWCDGVLVGW